MLRPLVLAVLVFLARCIPRARWHMVDAGTQIGELEAQLGDHLHQHQVSN